MSPVGFWPLLAQHGLTQPGSPTTASAAPSTAAGIEQALGHGLEGELGDCAAFTMYCKSQPSSCVLLSIHREVTAHENQ